MDHVGLSQAPPLQRPHEPLLPGGVGEPHGVEAAVGRRHERFAGHPRRLAAVPHGKRPVGVHMHDVGSLNERPQPGEHVPREESSPRSRWGKPHDPHASGPSLLGRCGQGVIRPGDGGDRGLVPELHSLASQPRDGFSEPAAGYGQPGDDVQNIHAEMLPPNRNRSHAAIAAR